MAAWPARCPHCGASALEEAAFCVECGGRMSSPPKVTTAIPSLSVPPPASFVSSRPPADSEPGVFDARTPDTTLEIADAELQPLPKVRSSSGASRPPPPPRRSSVVSKAPPPPSARAEAPEGPSEASETPSAPTAGDPVSGPPAAEASPSGMRRMLDDIDQTFDSILTPPREGASAGELTAEELTEAQRLFRDLAAGYLAPVRSFMVELSLGDPSKDWLSVCRPALASLKRAAGDMALAELAHALGALDEVMEQSERTASTVVDSRSRESLRVAYDRLVALLPEAFTVSDERDRREPIIVLSLLRQVPDVRKVALDRLAAAGLTNLELFYKAKPADIAEAAGIPRDLAERVVARFQRYRREMTSQPPTPQRTRERTALETLLRRLDEQNMAFQSSARLWQRGEDKRRIRQERASTVLEINLLLARLGEVSLIERLERLPFQQKSEELRRFLATESE